MVKYIVLYLNALAKLQNPNKAWRDQALIGNCSTCSHIAWLYQSTKWLALSLLWVWDAVATREVPIKKKVDMKCIQVNVLKNIARMTRRLYVHIMSHKRFRVNLHSVVAWMSTISLLQTDAISEAQVTVTGFESTITLQKKVHPFSQTGQMIKWLNLAK